MQKVCLHSPTKQTTNPPKHQHKRSKLPVGEMTSLIMPTVSESDELFTNGFVIVQERQAVTSPQNAAAKPVWKQSPDGKVRPNPLRQRSSFLWCDHSNDKRRKRRSRQSGHGRQTKSVTATTTTNPPTATGDDGNHPQKIILTKNHIIETTMHTKTISDEIPRRPIRSLPSLYFPWYLHIGNVWIGTQPLPVE